MTAKSQRDIALEALRLSSMPPDDDQLSRRTGITPRQRINQLCRALADDGLIRRYLGPDDKIVNEFVNPGLSTSGAPAEYTVERQPDRAQPPGSSHEQRTAERVMLDLLGVQLGLTLAPATTCRGRRQ